MSTTYKTIAGDTFNSIARKTYGTDLRAENISRANPGVEQPLAADLTITIPEIGNGRVVMGAAKRS